MAFALGAIAILFAIVVLIKVFKSHSAVTAWIFAEIIYNCVIKYAVGYMGVPSVANYGSDLIMLIIIFQYAYCNMRVPRSQRYRIPRTMAAIVALLFGICLISWVVNMYSPILFAWGLRNDFRFLVFAMIASAVLTRKDIVEIAEILFCFLILNLIVVAYQSATFSSGFGSAYGDYVSGLFSNGETARGGNASLNILMCIVSAYAIAAYLEKEKKLWYVLVAVGAALCIAAMNETKVFFVEIPLLVLIALVVSRKSAKTILVAVLIIVGIFGAIEVLYYFFPKFAGFFTFDSIYEYATADTGYIGANSINRGNSITYVFANFLTEPLQQIFGIGLGNADYSSSFSILTSAFYRQYSWTAYQWFYAPLLLIETGLCGFVVYILYYVNLLRVNKRVVPKDPESKALKNLAYTLIVLSLFMFFYNQSLRLETMGFALQVFVCLPFVLGRGERSQNPRERGITKGEFSRGSRHGR